jgi:hypothetical protein
LLQDLVVRKLWQIIEKLNRKSEKWEYAISDPTTSSAYKTERYAYIWRTAKLNWLSKPWLEQIYSQEIDREPFLCYFQTDKSNLQQLNFRTITKRCNPEQIKYFSFLPS